MKQELTAAKIDIVALAEEISARKSAYKDGIRYMSKKQKKEARRSVNLLIRQYNKTIGKDIIDTI